MTKYDIQKIVNHTIPMVIDILNSTAEPFLSETELKIEEDIIMKDE
jgi:hypothetical protein